MQFKNMKLHYLVIERNIFLIYIYSINYSARIILNQNLKTWNLITISWNNFIKKRYLS